MSYRILEYYAENFKRLRLVEFKPKGRMTVFTGKNDQGKTSALDAIPFALGGKKYSPEMPLRRGASKFKIRLNLGDIVVERTASGLTVQTAPGVKAWDTPQAMLDSIFDELAFDPMEFVKLDAKKQVEMLRKSVVIAEDLEELNRLNSEDFAARTTKNAEAKRLAGEAAAFPIQEGLPAEKVDENAIAEKIRNAGELNKQVIAQIEAKAKLHAAIGDAKAARDRNALFIATTKSELEQRAGNMEIIRETITEAESIGPKIEAIIAVCTLANVNSRLTEARQIAAMMGTEANKELAEQARRMGLSKDALQAAEAQEETLEQSVVDAQNAWEAAPAGELLDTNTLLEELQEAQKVNREIARRDRRQEIDRQREEVERDARELTRRMDDREERKRDAIAKAKMPVEGLTFTESQVLYNGIPLQQLGEAAQIRISVALVLARNPKLRLVRIPHGEALDEEQLAELAKMAEEMDFYVWMAKVDTTGKVGIYLEDGEVKANNG
jgi:hypothetical protein